MQTLIKFGSFTPISPKSYGVQRSDLDSEDSGRSETGVMFRNRIRAGVYKIQVTWRVNRSQLSAIATAISPDSFSATFFDPTTASTKTCTMYAGDRSATMVLNADTAAETLWDLSVNFIEY